MPASTSHTVKNASLQISLALHQPASAERYRPAGRGPVASRRAAFLCSPCPRIAGLVLISPPASTARARASAQRVARRLTRAFLRHSYGVAIQINGSKLLGFAAMTGNPIMSGPLKSDDQKMGMGSACAPTAGEQWVVPSCRRAGGGSPLENAPDQQPLP